jgi:hypothetical protein
MSLPRFLRLSSPFAAAVVLSLLTASILDGSRLLGSTSQRIIAEGTYAYGARDDYSGDKTTENWTLSKTAAGTYIVEGNETKNLRPATSTPETEILHYRLEMDAKLHPSLVELHTAMDYPSYTCKLALVAVQCILSWEDSGPPNSGPQNARMQPPFDLFGFHSYGWIFSSIVGRLRPGQSLVTVHLFLPNEDRYPNAVAEVRRKTPDPITIAGKTIEAQRFTVKLIMDATDISSATVWTSRSGLVLKMQDVEKPSPGDLPVMELTRYKQTEAFIPEMQ